MTIEMAADCVISCRGRAKLELFEHFVDYFNWQRWNQEHICMFAELCGFQFAEAMEE